MHNGKLGKMKDELCKTTNDGETIINTFNEARFLKAKAFCYTTVKSEKETKLKVFTIATIKNQIIREEYENAIYDCKSKNVTNYAIDSKKHHIETEEQNWIAIDSYDDKGIRVGVVEFGFYF